MKTQIIKNKRVVYFADPMLSSASESIEEEYDFVARRKFINNGFDFENVICVDITPFGNVTYDILIFDWGGMSMGNSLLESYCKYILDEAEDNPNTYYVMASTFTKYAMEDAMYDLKNELHNVFLDVDSFIEFYKKIELK